MPKRNRDGEDGSQNSNNGTVTIKEEVMSPTGTAASATTTTTASASTNNMGDRTKDVEELKGMLRTSMDQQAESVATIETQKATIDQLKKDALLKRDAQNEILKATVKKMDNILHIRCTQQLLTRLGLACYPNPKLLDIVRQGKITPHDLDWDTAPFGSAFVVQYVHLTKCSELVAVFKNGLSPEHKLDLDRDAKERIAIHVLTRPQRGPRTVQAITNENKDDFIILGASTWFFSKPLAEFIYDKEWPELTRELWKKLPHHGYECELYVRTPRVTQLPKFIQAGLSAEPYNAVVKNVHIPKADNPREATECDIDLDRMVVVDVVTKVERYLDFRGT